MKRFIIVITSIALMLSFIPFASFAQNGLEEGSRIYTNYLYYKNEDLKRAREGYVIDHLEIFLKNNYDENGERIIPAKETFGDVKDLIESIPYTTSKFTTVNLNCFKFDGTPVYTEEQIDEYVKILEYIDTLPFVVSVHPGYKSIPYADNEKYPLNIRSEYEFATGVILVVLFKEFTAMTLPEDFFIECIPEEIDSIKIETYNKNQLENGAPVGIYKITFENRDPEVTLKFARALYEDPRVKGLELNYKIEWEFFDDLPKGDVNRDGNVNMKDILLLRSALSGVEELSEKESVGADVNGDGAINMKDVLMLRHVLAGEE